ncbi:MAG: hypothetical protein K2X82_14700 [Gemmataceae bacterium]|nr:hypothetical protein [Gemmataceae bacterium]
MVTRRRRPRFEWIAALALLCWPTDRAHAGFVNGGFEAGTFEGWDRVGAAQVLSSAGSVPPPGGAYQAYLENFSFVPASALAEFLGVPLESLAALSAEPITEGTAVAQDVTAAAGDVIRFGWNFLTNEDPGDLFNDFAFVTVAPAPPGATGVLADTLTPGTAAAPGTEFLRQTGYRAFEFAVREDGVYRVGVGVANVRDLSGSSALLVDNFQIDTARAVPAPPGLTLLAVGAAGLAIGRLRQVGRDAAAGAGPRTPGRAPAGTEEMCPEKAATVNPVRVLLQVVESGEHGR